jgi:hypothetical protein
VSPRGHVCQTCRTQRSAGASRAVRLAQTYGLTADEYALILAGQGERCAICRRKPRYNLDVDHDHRNGLVRGLLCKLCNRRLLPSVRDDACVLYLAISYLADPPAPAALGRKIYVPEAA